MTKAGSIEATGLDTAMSIDSFAFGKPSHTSIAEGGPRNGDGSTQKHPPFGTAPRTTGLNTTNATQQSAWTELFEHVKCDRPVQNMTGIHGV
jgi:hypothetical protein